MSGTEPVSPAKAMRLIPAYDPGSTSGTLLERVRDTSDQASWKQFLEKYYPAVYAYGLKKLGNHPDADAVASDVLSKLLMTMPTFDYDPLRSFRAFLWVVTKRQVATYRRECKRHGQPHGVGGTSIGGQSPRLQYRDSSKEELDQSVTDFQENGRLLLRAMHRVRRRVQANAPLQWKAFWLRYWRGKSGSYVASKVGITPTQVYQATFQVKKQIVDAFWELQAQ